ncbi:hypothetical protein PN925_003645 [Morganella morganii]|uniref:Uncharacterized protein n=1 Tax=Morganella morganii TaxID=582 RepID=A0AAI9MTY3_MORMO|nr:hypothetical protein [Morganella morganii]
MTADTSIDADSRVYMQATHALGSGSDPAGDNRLLPAGYQVGSLTNSGTIEVTRLVAGPYYGIPGIRPGFHTSFPDVCPALTPVSAICFATLST